MTSFSPAPACPFSSADLERITGLVPYSADRALEMVSALRAQGLDAEQTSALLTQARLRTAARAKWGETADQLLFTEAGVEQATRAAVARLHAQRFVDAGISSVADLGCGLGADSLAFAQAGLAVTAVELDPHTASFTAHNLSPFPDTQVLVGNVEEVDLEALTTKGGLKVEALWLDPARREVEGGATTSRIFDPEAFSPPLSFVEKLAATGIPMGVKMGPGIPHEHIPANCEAQWVSHGGSVVEVVLWFNALARLKVRRAAAVLTKNPLEPELLGELTSPHESAEVTGAEEHEPVVGELAAYLAEPDGAVVRAHLVADFAQQLGAHFLDEKIAYLTSEQPLATDLAQVFEVKQVLSLQEKALKRWVKEAGITALTIKKRGVDIVPEQLRAKLLAGAQKKKKGTAVPATLFITRLGSGAESHRIAIHANPLLT